METPQDRNLDLHFKKHTCWHHFWIFQKLNLVDLCQAPIVSLKYSNWVVLTCWHLHCWKNVRCLSFLVSLLEFAHVGSVIGIIVGRGVLVHEARCKLRGLTDVVIDGFIRTDVCGGIGSGAGHMMMMRQWDNDDKTTTKMIWWWWWDDDNDDDDDDDDEHLTSTMTRQWWWWDDEMTMMRWWWWDDYEMTMRWQW